MRDLLIAGGKVVAGNGGPAIPLGYLLVRDGMIAAVGEGNPPTERGIDRIDASGKVVMPGVINTHAHGCTPGPLSPIAAPSLTQDQIRTQLDRHLLGGETTVLCVCGFCLPKDAARAEPHPVRVCLATSHTAANVRAAQLVDGAGFTAAHLLRSVEQSLQEGAVAIGEIGAGHTLGGNGQDYGVIPPAIEKATGVRLRVDQARALRWAVLGKIASRDAFDASGTEKALRAAGLDGKLSVQEARTLIEGCVIPPISEALTGFEEAALLSARTGKRVVMHNSTVSVRKIAELAKRYPKARLVAGHSNQQDFAPEEAVNWAKRLRDMGVVIDISTWDCPGKAIHAKPEAFVAMLAAGVVDTVSTDFAGGEWEPVLKGLALAIARKAIQVDSAIRLATGNPADLFPELADGRGTLAVGKVGDVVIADENDISRVRTVLVRGQIVVDQGRRVSGLTPNF